MAQTPSNMIALGTIAPKFELLDTISNSKMKLDNLKGSKGTVIAFICNHCPFVVHINDEFVKIANQYQKKGISFIAISSNDIDKYIYMRWNQNLVFLTYLMKPKKLLKHMMQLVLQIFIYLIMT